MPLPETVPMRGGGSVTIRRSRPEDAEAHIANLTAIGAERLFLMTEEFTRTVDEVRAQFRDADPARALWLAAEVDGRVVGGANAARGRFSKNAHTADFGIAILAAYRGRGIGEALLRVAIDWARAVGIRKLTLGVFATNERAIRLYRKLGFQEEARLRGQVMLEGQPVDEVLMALWLEPAPSSGPPA